MGKVSGHQSLMPKSDIARALSLFLIVGAIGFAGFCVFFYVAPVKSFARYAPEQPIPYSHKLHAGELEINCQYCHSYARRSEIAGIPSLAKCMNCHSNIELESPAIDDIAKRFEEQKPVEWIRVYELPDHVWFSHKRHIAKQIDCSECHGAVETLDINAQLVDYQMGFCLDCHQANDASTDCWTCHT